MSDQYNFNGPMHQTVVGTGATGNFYNDGRLSPVMEEFKRFSDAVLAQGGTDAPEFVAEIGNEIAVPERRATAIQKLTALTVAAGTGTAVAEAAKALIEVVQSLH